MEILFANCNKLLEAMWVFKGRVMVLDGSLFQDTSIMRSSSVILTVLAWEMVMFVCQNIDREREIDIYIYIYV